MSGNNQVNLDFQAELAALMGKTTQNVGTEHFQDYSPERMREEEAKAAARAAAANGKVDHLKAPGNVIEDTAALKNSVTTAQLFGDNAIEGEIPELTQDFTMLASKKDRLMELGTVAQEVYQTKKVSRSQVLAMESIAREILPATAEEEANNQRAVLVQDHELNMFTEAPSAVEAQNTIENSQVVIDRALGEIRNSTKALGEKIIQVAQSDQARRNEALVQGISTFNGAIIKFLDNTGNTDLVDSRIKFRADLNWGNLMAMNIDFAQSQAMGYDRDSATGEKIIAAFDGTSAETLFKGLGDFMAENAIATPVISNFISGKFNVIRNDGDRRASFKEQSGEEYISYTQTIGMLFETFGSHRFVEFFNMLNDYIGQEIANVKLCLEELPQATDIQAVTKRSIAIQCSHSNIMAASANMAVICAVQQMVKDFLEKFQ